MLAAGYRVITYDRRASAPLAGPAWVTTTTHLPPTSRCCWMALTCGRWCSGAEAKAFCWMQTGRRSEGSRVWVSGTRKGLR